MQQNTQAMNMAISNSVLHRAKPEILSIVEHLIEKMHVEMTELLVEVNWEKLICIEFCSNWNYVLTNFKMAV